MFDKFDGDERDGFARRQALTTTATEGWQRSSFCTAGTCVELRFNADRVSIRDSKESGDYEDAELQPMLHVDVDVFAGFLAEVVGQAEPGSNGSLVVSGGEGGTFQLSSTKSSVKLTYDKSEWQAFVEGAIAGEFKKPMSAAVS